MNDLIKLKLVAFTKGLSFFVPIIGLYFTDNGVTLQALVYSQVIYVIFMMISEIPTGILGDVLGHKYSLALSNFVSATSHILMLLFPTTIGLYIAYAIRGTGGAMASGSDTALMHKYCQTHNLDFKKNLAQKQSYYILGFILSGLIMGGLMQIMGDGAHIWGFILTFIGLIFGGVTSLSIKTKLVKQEEDKIKTGANMLEYIKVGFKHIRSVNCLFWYTILFGLFMPGFHTFKQIYQPHFESIGVSPFMIGAVLSIGLGLNFLLLRFGYDIISKLGKNKSLMIIYLFVIIGLGVLGLFTDPWLAVIGFIIYLSMAELDQPIKDDYYNEHTP